MVEQLSIFTKEKNGRVLEPIPIVDGELYYAHSWLDAESANTLFTTLRKTVEWQQSTINLYGKNVMIPRLNAWYGDEDSPYQYSGHYFEPLPWLDSLYSLKIRLEQETGHNFNSVLANCYRDGKDSVAWHSDDEPELGVNPVIASVSLGEERVFCLRHKSNKNEIVRKINLTHGSLLLMSGSLQQHWQHQIPKVSTKVGERINLTYRYVIPKNST
jgi:alkylated DNA repair dioxygenase AlkB